MILIKFLYFSQSLFSYILYITGSCLGLIQSKGCYIPNSVLSEDIRSIAAKPPEKCDYDALHRLNLNIKKLTCMFPHR